MNNHFANQSQTSLGPANIWKSFFIYTERQLWKVFQLMLINVKFKALIRLVQITTYIIY